MYKINISVTLLHSSKTNAEHLMKKIDRERHMVAHSSVYPVHHIRQYEDVRKNKVFEFTFESRNNDFDDAEKRVTGILKKLFIRTGVSEEDIRIDDAIFEL